jgi:subfamily B ATP-binding cassette protein HlyB/CyaB
MEIKENNSTMAGDAPTDDGDGLQAAAALAIVAHCHQIACDPEAVYREFSPLGNLNETGLCRAAGRLGLKARATRLNARALERLPLPAMVRLKDDGWAVLAKAAEDTVLYQIPGCAPEKSSAAGFLERCGPRVILLAWRSGAAPVEWRSGLRWFLPAFWKYRRTIAQILLASLILQFLALGTPLLFQVVMDKVLPHAAASTLNVVATAMITIALFETVIGYLRSYLVSHTASRMDVELGSRLYDHLLRLPLSYFHSRQIGQTVARVRELDTVREFLTSSALTVVLDAVFAGTAFAVLCFYSLKLTGIVGLSVILYFLISLIISPVLRLQLERLFQRAAVNQSFLVESISGAETVKAMAIEPVMRHYWEGNLASYVAQGFKLSMLGAGGMKGIELVSKLGNVGIIWLGAGMVQQGLLTLGELVAFNMIAGQMSGPVLRLAQIWQQFQQLRISLDRIGDILRTPVEPGSDMRRPPLPSLGGHIVFDHVSFRYAADGPPVLSDISLNIPAGAILGIVGRSGSGKSTMSRLVQRLHVPESGRILIDGHDIAQADPSWLRRQVGVVLQENFLFNRSIRDNIAVCQPSMAMSSVVEAASLAGAHEFILELPHGYDTLLEERGSNLSGGQRQRIAIARALAARPRILILDEATSALDYESEALFQANLERIAKGRTVLIIAHRLSTVRMAHRIVGIERGRVTEEGTHHELIARGGLYAQLHRLQQT